MTDQIIPSESPTLALLPNRCSTYVKALKDITKLAKQHNLTIADLPIAIEAMLKHPSIRKLLRADRFVTRTSEYTHQRSGNMMYETWHSVGSLSSYKGIEQRLNEDIKLENWGNFISIANAEWTAMGTGNEVVRVHLDDVKKNDIPAIGTPHIIFVRVDKDDPLLNPKEQLTLPDFMTDDRSLMLAGSLENRAGLANIIYGSKTDGGEGKKTVDNQYGTCYANSETKIFGKIMGLDFCYNGFNRTGLTESAKFLGVCKPPSNNLTITRETTPAEIYHLLSTTLKIIDNPDLNRGDMIREVNRLYNK